MGGFTRRSMAKEAGGRKKRVVSIRQDRTGRHQVTLELKLEERNPNLQKLLQTTRKRQKSTSDNKTLLSSAGKERKRTVKER